MKTFLAALALSTLPFSAFAHEFTLGELIVGHPKAFETHATAQTGAGYMQISNNGDTDDRLLEVRADFPRVMMHRTEQGDDGVSRMMHTMSIEIPAGETVTFEPGGLHVMFMGLGGDPFEDGEKIEATLVFEKAGELDVVFNVEPREGAEETTHADH